jgi:Flp pilus assembly pilin Flp
MDVKLRNDSGQAALELAVLVGLIAMVALGVLIFMGSNTSHSLQNSADAVNSATQPYSPTQ